MVYKEIILFMVLNNSQIDFATSDVPDIKVWYDMLIDGRNLGNTLKKKVSNLLLSRHIESTSYCFQSSRQLSMDF